MLLPPPQPPPECGSWVGEGEGCDGAGSAGFEAPPDAFGIALLRILFDFGDGTAPVTQTSAIASHAYAGGGITYVVKVTVTDSSSNSLTSAAEAPVTVN